MSGWRATIPTERLFGDPRFLRLEEELQNLLLRLYSRCDRWGRGPAHPRVLPLHLMVVRANAREQLDQLAKSGLVLVYSVAGDDFYEIERYDEDALRDTVRKRGTSNYPGPTENHPQGQTDTPVKASEGQTRAAEPLPQGQTQAGPDPQKTGGHSAHARGSRAEHSVAEQSGGRARPPTPAHVPARVYEPSVLEAVARWQRSYTALVPTGMVDDASVLTVAADFTPEVFARGVERHVDEGVQFWNRTPLRFLRIRCEWERDRPPRDIRPKKPNGKPKPLTYAELNAMGYETLQQYLDAQEAAANAAGAS